MQVPTATADWKGTGITPKDGVRIRITATGSGTYCAGCIAPTPAGDTTQTAVCGGGYSGLGGVACIALVGRWAGGGAFVIGKGTTITAPGGKELQLGIHDWKFDDNSGTYRVVLERSQMVSVTGKAMQGVKPADGGCRVDVVPLSGARILLKGEHDTHRTTTDADGGFEFNVPKGRYSLKGAAVEGKSWFPAERTLQIDRPETGLRLYLCPIPNGGGDCRVRKVTGRAVDLDGQPYPDITVIALDREDRLLFDQDATDGAGRFTLWLPDGAYRLHTYGHVRAVSVAGAPVSGLLLRHKPRFEDTYGPGTNTTRRVRVTVFGFPAAGGRFLVRLKDVPPGPTLCDRQDATILEVGPSTLGADVDFDHRATLRLCRGAYNLTLRWLDQDRTLVTKRINLRPPDPD